MNWDRDRDLATTAADAMAARYLRELEGAVSLPEGAPALAESLLLE